MPRPAPLSGSSARNTHILQGGVENGDKAWREKAAQKRLSSESWIAPKTVRVGDYAIIYVGGYGFFATARVKSLAAPREDWPKRYGAALDSIKLIKPPISLGIIRKRLPRLEWATYPRSVTTLSPTLARAARNLIEERRSGDLLEIKDRDLNVAGLDELRRLAYLSAKSRLSKNSRLTSCRRRSQNIHAYVLRRANGLCEGCNSDAPFKKKDGTPYLEPHHTIRVADDGPDHPATIIALCPTCHRRAHSSFDSEQFNTRLKKRVAIIERYWHRTH
jgi:5-methylcytosine-specific restriction protein A